MGATVTIERQDMPQLKTWLEKFCGKDAVMGVEIGVFEDATNEQTGERIAEYAAYNEFGTTKIPRRPFLGQTFQEQSKKYANIIAGGIQANIDTPERALRVAFSAAGRVAQEDVVLKIKSNMPPDNSEKTKARKNAEERGVGTLIDTASLINSIGFRLTDVNGGHIA